MENITKYPLNNCPKCNSDNISGGPFEADGSSAWQDIECEKCGFGWQEVYNFAYLEEQDNEESNNE
jgi:transcription elongation factor Elf1